MTINWHRVRKVVLNDRVTSYTQAGDPVSLGYKPTIKDLRKISTHIPDAKIHGFMHYGFGSLWCVLIESGQFFEDESDTIKTLSWFQAINKPLLLAEKL